MFEVVLFFLYKVALLVLVTGLVGTHLTKRACVYTEESQYSETNFWGWMYGFSWMFVGLPLTMPAWFWLFGVTNVAARWVECVYAILLLVVPCAISCKVAWRYKILEMQK